MGVIQNHFTHYTTIYPFCQGVNEIIIVFIVVNSSAVILNGADFIVFQRDQYITLIIDNILKIRQR